MGLIERLSSVLQNKTANNSVAKKPYFGLGFNANALSNRNLNQDVFVPIDNNYATSTFANNTELALNQPIRFINKYANEKTIKNALAKNPNIARILKDNGLSTNYNLDNINSITMSHLIPTSKAAQRIYKKMGHSETEASYVHLTQAGLLHDIGKCFIPSEILNKAGKLTPKERQIVELHNQLSAEILKTTDLDPTVAKLAFEHHNYNKQLNRSQENQALTIADVYCALKEERPYKKALSDLSARAILYDMGTKGSFDPRYIRLVNA